MRTLRTCGTSVFSPRQSVRNLHLQLRTLMPSNHLALVSGQPARLYMEICLKLISSVFLLSAQKSGGDRLSDVCCWADYRRKWNILYQLSCFQIKQTSHWTKVWLQTCLVEHDTGMADDCTFTSHTHNSSCINKLGFFFGNANVLKKLYLMMAREMDKWVFSWETEKQWM